MNRTPASWALLPLLPVTQGGGGGAPVPGGSDAAWRTPAARWGAVTVAALMLAWPAFWNGQPLVFAGTSTYLEQASQIYLGWDRPPFYSAFLFATH